MYIVLHTVATKKIKVFVHSLEEARDVWINHRNGNNDLYEFIASSQMKKDCCNIYEEDFEEKIAEISYNGKIKKVQKLIQ